jgi:hypothetical protein
MTPNESKIFLRFLGVVALFWLGTGAILFRGDLAARGAFFLTFQAVILDFSALVLLFWTVFFSRSSGLAGKLITVLLFTFKLVCLGFLAITLKRLRNDPHLPAAFAVSFMGIGPLLAGVAARKWIGSKQG